MSVVRQSNVPVMLLLVCEFYLKFLLPFRLPLMNKEYLMTANHSFPRKDSIQNRPGPLVVKTDFIGSVIRIDRSSVNSKWFISYEPKFWASKGEFN